MAAHITGPVHPIPVIPGGGGGGGGGPPPTPGTNYEMLLYRLLFPYYTPGGLMGQDDYFTLLTANAGWKANVYQRLYGNPTPAPKPVSMCVVINLSTDNLTVSNAPPGKTPTNPSAGQSKVLNAATAAGQSGGYAVYPAVDMDDLWIQGPSGSDAYVVEWYVPNPAVVPL